MRIGGLASGMDTEQMIKDLMRVQRLPMDKLTQRKQSIEWQRDAYRSINTQMSKFNTNIFDTIMRSANMSAKTVTSSNSSRITATATAAAANSSFTISKVDRLATAATNSTLNSLTMDGETSKIDPTKSFQSQNFAGDFNWKGEQTFTEVQNQQQFQLESGVKIDVSQFKVVVGATENSPGVIYSNENIVFSRDELTDGKVFVDVENGTFEFNEPITGDVNVTYNKPYTTFAITTYNISGEPVREDFEIFDTDSLNSVISKINASKVGVNAFYDNFSDKITLMRKETGNNHVAGVEMKFEGDFLTSVLGLDEGAETGGDNAKFTINGLETERPTNNFTINGVTITLKEAFTDSPVTLNVNTNTDKIFDTIKSFVDEYNELLATINGKLKEERYRDFRPLTDEQKEAMSEKDIEKWEEKAMSGMLRNDQTLSNALDRMRSAMYSPVSLSGDNPTFKQLAELGITTSRDYMERGKLEIDEAKLRAAIEKDPDGVFQIFNADGPTSAEKGLARRMRENLAGAMDQVAERAGGSRGKNLNHQFTLGRNITDIDRQISNFERRLKQIEDRYWKQFSAMEKAMQQANSQAETMFAQLFGGQQ